MVAAESRLHLGTLALMTLVALLVRLEFLHQPMRYDESVTFVHYALDETGHGFKSPARHPDSAVMDGLFAPQHAELVFYGHQHYPSAVNREIVGRATYVNPEALGCGPAPVARYALLEVDRTRTYRLGYRAISYDPVPLFQAFEERVVPEGDFIRRTFFGGQGSRSPEHVDARRRAE